MFALLLQRSPHTHRLQAVGHRRRQGSRWRLSNFGIRSKKHGEVWMNSFYVWSHTYIFTSNACSGFYRTGGTFFTKARTTHAHNRTTLHPYYGCLRRRMHPAAQPRRRAWEEVCCPPSFLFVSNKNVRLQFECIRFETMEPFFLTRLLSNRMWKIVCANNVQYLAFVDREWMAMVVRYKVKLNDK